MGKTLRQRFWEKVDVAGPDECWNWTASLRNRYGSFKMDRKTHTAHRVAYTLAKGEIPEGHVVRHTCDNPTCCNPSHLETGTQADNVRDRTERRGTYHVRGEAHGRTKLTRSNVLRMRELYKNGGITQVALAKRFGVSQISVLRILNRQTWKHV